VGRVGQQSYRKAADQDDEFGSIERKCAGEANRLKWEADLLASRGSVEGNVSWERRRTQGQRAALTPCWRRLGYLAPIQLLHALSVGVIAKALTRTRQAPQHDR